MGNNDTNKIEHGDFTSTLNRSSGTILFLYVLSSVLTFSGFLNLEIILGFVMLMIIIFPILWYLLPSSNIVKIKYPSGVCKVCGNTNLSRSKLFDSSNKLCSNKCAIVNGRISTMFVAVLFTLFAIGASFLFQITDITYLFFVLLSQSGYVSLFFGFHLDSNQLRSQMKTGNEKAIDLIDRELEKKPDDTGLLSEKGMYLKRSG
ncbi:MAG: hypothetical protein ACXAC2_25260, partial [Candidatus Kariarchaeaceae archaeon]